VYFVNGVSETAFKSDLETIIRCQGAQYRLKTFDDGIQWLSTRPNRWLMIIDNVDDPSMNLFPLIPKAQNCHVIITTRDSTRLGLANSHSRHIVGELDKEASIELLLRLSSCPLNDANTVLASQIAAELGYLPLALAHAGGYISIHGGLASYLETYRKSRRDMLEHLPPGLPSDYNLAVAATIEMSFTRLPHRTREILCLLSHFQAGSIAEAIIVRAAERGFTHVASPSAIPPPAETREYAEALVEMFFPNGQWSQHDFNQLIQPCLQSSLLRSGESEKMGRYFSMHPLVQSWLRLQTREDASQSKQDLFIRLLASSITIGARYEHMEFNQVLRPHIHLLDEKEVGCIGDKHGFRYVLDENGDYSRAFDYLERCVKEERKLLGEEHQETLESMHNISICCSRVGRYAEALEMAEKVTGLRQKTLGYEHPDTLRSMHALSIRYSQVGRYAEALEMGEKVTGLRQNILGYEHPDTLHSMHSLSIGYSQVGRYAEALEVGEKVMGLRQRTLGYEHPDTLLSMHNLSIGYSEVGRYAEALELAEKVTGLYEKTLGYEHPDTLRSMHNLSTRYSQVGRYAEALEMGEKLTGLYEKTLGYEHPDTLLSMHNLSIRYSQVGRYVEALEMGEKVTGLYQKTLGDNHPATLRSMHDLSIRYSQVGRYAEALEMGEKVTGLYEKTLGHDHPATLRSMHNLSIGYSEVGRHVDALDMGLRAIGLYEKVLGKDHLLTLDGIINVSSYYSKLGKYAEALRLALNAVDPCQRILGLDHPQTKRALKTVQYLRSMVCSLSWGIFEIPEIYRWSQNTSLNDPESEQELNPPAIYHGEQSETGSRINHQRYEISLSVLATDNIHSDNSDMRQDNPEPHLSEQAFAKEESNVNFGSRNRSGGDKSVQSHRKGKESAVKAGHRKRMVIRRNESPDLSSMETDVAHDEEYGGLVMATGGVRRSGRTKRTRTNSQMEETEVEKVNRVRIGGQSKVASTSISSQVNKEMSGSSRRTKKLSRRKGRWE
jgi:tetratricopeptide (TPR) repeat protein